MAAIVNLDINEGDTFLMDLDLWSDEDNTIPVDLTDSTFKGQFQFSTSKINMTITVTLPNFVHISVPYGLMVSLPSVGKYDIDQLQNGENFRLIQGKVRVNQEVTT